MENILEARKLNKYFEDADNLHVLKDIDLTLKKGEFATIMGKSGCGKSTLLYALSTMDTSYGGELYLDNELLTGKSNRELADIRNRKIGFVFQFHYLLKEFTVLQNVMLPALKSAKKSDQEIEHDAMEKLRQLGIDHLAHKKALNISGGERQRVAIARALINEPKIIMGDEPTGNLDSKNSDAVFDIFREICDTNNQSILIVTHDQDFADRTDRIIMMEDGRVT